MKRSCPTVGSDRRTLTHLLAVDDLPIKFISGDFEHRVDSVDGHPEVFLDFAKKTQFVVPDATTSAVHESSVEAATSTGRTVRVVPNLKSTFTETKPFSFHGFSRHSNHCILRPWFKPSVFHPTWALWILIPRVFWSVCVLEPRSKLRRGEKCAGSQSKPERPCARRWRYHLANKFSSRAFSFMFN